MYDDAYKVKGGAVVRLILDLPEELISELESRAEERGKNTSDLIREALELYFRQRTVIRPMGDISEHPEVKRVIESQDEMRRRLEGNGYSGSAVVGGVQLSPILGLVVQVR